MLDLSNLTLGEVAFIENKSGMAISSIADEDAPKGLALAAIATVAKRRSGEPNFNFEDALALSMEEATALIQPADEVEEYEEGKEQS